MSKSLNNILNSRRKAYKINGRVIAKQGHLKYVVATSNGRMLVDSLTPYKLGQRVVIYDGLIQGEAGSEPPATMSDV